MRPLTRHRPIHGTGNGLLWQRRMLLTYYDIPPQGQHGHPRSLGIPWSTSGSWCRSPWRWIDYNCEEHLALLKINPTFDDPSVPSMRPLRHLWGIKLRDSPSHPLDHCVIIAPLELRAKVRVWAITEALCDLPETPKAPLLHLLRLLQGLLLIGQQTSRRN